MSEPDRKLEQAYAAVSARQRGDMISHEELERLLGVTRNSLGWMAAISALKRAVLDRLGIELWSERSKGYRLCPVTEQLHDVPRRRQKRALKQLRKASDALEALPSTEMSPEQQTARAFRLRALDELRTQAKDSLRRQERAGRERLPLRPLATG